LSIDFKNINLKECKSHEMITIINQILTFFALFLLKEIISYMQIINMYIQYKY